MSEGDNALTGVITGGIDTIKRVDDDDDCRNLANPGGISIRLG